MKVVMEQRRENHFEEPMAFSRGQMDSYGSGHRIYSPLKIIPFSGFFRSAGATSQTTHISFVNDKYRRSNRIVEAYYHY